MVSKALVRDGNNHPIQHPSVLFFNDAAGYQSPLLLEVLPPKEPDAKPVLQIVYLTPPENAIALRFRSFTSNIYITVPIDFELNDNEGEYVIPKGEEGRIPCLGGHTIGLTADETTNLYFAFEMI